MSVEVPENTPLLAGMKTAVTLVTYRNEEAISVPDAAIIRTDGEPTVKLKMADGKHELRPVKTGKSAKGRTEILSGLEADQVILIPDN
jgi:Cu(I)/Ag(I) efflux system membrane fusion protein